MASISDVYATSLYAAAEGLPLWHPGLVELGDMGYVRDGRFYVSRSNVAQLRSCARLTRSSFTFTAAVQHRFWTFSDSKRRFSS